MRVGEDKRVLGASWPFNNHVPKNKMFSTDGLKIKPCIIDERCHIFSSLIKIGLNVVYLHINRMETFATNVKVLILGCSNDSDVAMTPLENWQLGRSPISFVIFHFVGVYIYNLLHKISVRREIEIKQH